MARQIPFTLRTEATVLSALRLRAAQEGRSPEEVAGDLLRRALAVEIEEASGATPLAEIIQQHHDQEQAAARARPGASRPPAPGSPET
jgi:plasmid stability protein